MYVQYNEGSRGLAMEEAPRQSNSTGDTMTEASWHRLWLLALLANGYTTREAHSAFYTLYGNRALDLNNDPIADALALVQRAANVGGKNVRSDISSQRLDGLLHQSRAA